MGPPTLSAAAMAALSAGGARQSRAGDLPVLGICLVLGIRLGRLATDASIECKRWAVAATAARRAEIGEVRREGLSPVWRGRPSGGGGGEGVRLGQAVSARA